MNFNHLKAFFAVAKCGSFTQACKELNVSQPTISLQVQELEKYCSNPLLIRSAKHVELTEEGKLIFSLAEKIFALFEQAEKAVVDLQKLHFGKLKIGATFLTVKDLAPKVVHNLKKRYPDIQIQLFTGSTKEILEKVINFEYHVGIVARTTYPNNMISKHIQEIKLCLITADNAIQEKIHLQDLANYPIILPPEGALHREIIVNEFNTRKIPLNIYAEAVDPTITKSMVRKGMGGAFMPLDAIEEEVKEGKFRVIEILDGVHFHFDLVYLSERRKSETVMSIISALKEINCDDIP